MTFTIRISRSTGATRRTGSNRVVIRKVASDLVCRSISSPSEVDFVDNGEPMCEYSWAKTIPSSLFSSVVKNREQNSCIDAGEDRSQCSAKMFSFEVVERRSSMIISTRGDEIGSGDSAIICAPR